MPNQQRQIEGLFFTLCEAIRSHDSSQPLRAVINFVFHLLFSCAQDVIKYTLVGDETAREFFYINPTTGEVSIKKPLSEGSASTYTVSTASLHFSRDGC